MLLDRSSATVGESIGLAVFLENAEGTVVPANEDRIVSLQVEGAVIEDDELTIPAGRWLARTRLTSNREGVVEVPQSRIIGSDAVRLG